MIRRADIVESEVISKIMNAGCAIDGSVMMPMSVDEAAMTVANAIVQIANTGDVDDYFVGQDAGVWYMTVLGGLNTVLAYLLPGVMLRPDGPRLTYWIDDERFIATSRDEAGRHRESSQPSDLT